MVYCEIFRPFNFNGQLGSQTITFEFLKINENLFYHLIMLHPCKEDAFSSFEIVKFETYSTLAK